MARGFASADDSYLSCSAVVGSVPLTMAGWFYNTVDGGGHQLMCISNSAAANESFLLQWAGNVAGDPIRAWQRNADTIGWAVTTSGVSSGEWFHAAGVFTANDERSALLNGASKDTDNTSVGSFTPNITSMGKLVRSTATSASDIWAAECGIWNVALTDAEVVVLAAGYSPLLVRPQNLVAYWPLIRDTDDDIVGGYSMTPVNSPTVAAHPRVFYPGMPHVGYAAAAIAALRIPRHPAAYYGGPTVF